MDLFLDSNRWRSWDNCQFIISGEVWSFFIWVRAFRNVGSLYSTYALIGVFSSIGISVFGATVELFEFSSCVLCYSSFYFPPSWGSYCYSVFGCCWVSSFSSSSSSDNGGSWNFHPFGFCNLFFYFFFAWLHVFCKCPIWWQTWHLKAVFSKSKHCVHLKYLCVRWIHPGKPFLKSTSTQMRAKVKIHFSILSLSIFMYLPREFLLPYKTRWYQKGSGILCSLTQISIFETTIEIVSKLGNHGVMKRSALPQNHGPLFITWL